MTVGLLLTATASVALAAPQVYGESLMVKVRPGTPPRAAEPVELIAARNEFVSFQVVVHGGEGGASGVSARTEGLSGPVPITGPQVTLYRVTYLDITRSSDGLSETGLWPDGLIPAVDEVAGEERTAFPFEVPAGQSRAIWVDIHVPLEAPPGRYEGTVEVTAEGGFRATVPYALRVVPVTLPSTSSVATVFLVEPSLICTAHMGTRMCASTEERVELVNRYQRLALDHRLTLSNAFVLPLREGGWEAFDAAYGPFIEGTAETRLKGARLTRMQYMGPPEADALADFVAHFRERGWLERAYDYTADEPPYFSTFEELRERAELVRRAAPELTILATTQLDAVLEHDLVHLVDTMAMIIQRFPFEGLQRPEYQEFLARPGRSLWLYQSCSSHHCGGNVPSPETRWPSYMIDSPAARNRAMAWLLFAEDVAGELYYGVVSKLPTAWTDQFFYGGNGDGTLFYPGLPAQIGGQSHVPLPSIRLKLIRAGLQDYEWLKLVREAGDAPFALGLARELIPASDKVSNDGAAFERARTRLIERLLELRSVVPAPPDPSPPDPAPPDPDPTSPAEPEPDRPPRGGGGCSSMLGSLWLGALPALLALWWWLARRR